MKTKTPAVPYTAEEKHCRNAAGDFVSGIQITVKAPSRIVAMLDENAEGWHIIPSAILNGLCGRDPLEDVPQRARSWKGAFSRPAKLAIMEGIEEGFDDEIHLLVSVAQWHAIGTLCGRLGITPGQWYLGSAAYNADLAEREISKMLENLPALV